MSEYYTNKFETLDYRAIILGHYKTILEISTTEFTGGYWERSIVNSQVHHTYITNKRNEYCQAVEQLALSAFPHFDEQMKEDYQKYITAKKALRATYQDKDGSFPIEVSQKYSICLLEIMKDLFRDLSCLLHRLDYFKTANYSEGDLKDVIDIDGREPAGDKEV